MFVNRSLADIDAVPLDTALSWSLALVESVARLHEEGLTVGQLSPKDVVVASFGAPQIVVKPKAGDDFGGDVLALGHVLARLFMGTSPGRDVEHAVDYVLGLMLEREPSHRPSLQVVEALLGDIYFE